jgi:type II secretory pathway component PulC
MALNADTIKDWLRKDPRVPLGISACLLLFTLSTVISTTCSFFTAPASDLTQNTPIVRPINTTNIAYLHLFGEFQPIPTHLPQTNLQLNLQGIALSTVKGQASIAIISTPSGNTKIYKLGDAVPGGATINKVFKNRIILNDNGRLEVLKLPIPKLKNPSNTQEMY